MVLSSEAVEPLTCLTKKANSSPVFSSTTRTSPLPLPLMAPATSPVVVLQKPMLMMKQLKRRMMLSLTLKEMLMLHCWAREGVEEVAGRKEAGRRLAAMSALMSAGVSVCPPRAARPSTPGSPKRAARTSLNVSSLAIRASSLPPGFLVTATPWHLAAQES